jgi:hypothetical protein
VIIYWFAYTYVNRIHLRRQEAEANAAIQEGDNELQESSSLATAGPTSSPNALGAATTADDEDESEYGESVSMGRSGFGSGARLARQDSARLKLLTHEHSPELRSEEEHGPPSPASGSNTPPPPQSSQTNGNNNNQQTQQHAIISPRRVRVAATDATASGEDGGRLLEDSSTASDSLSLPAAGESGWQRTVRVTKHIASPALQLCCVYFFEYMVSVGFASKANKGEHGDWFRRNAYEVLAFCYQLGVLFARSSVSIIQIRRIELLTIAQGAHFVAWFIQIALPYIPLWLQFLDMVVVGLLGGAM